MKKLSALILFGLLILSTMSVFHPVASADVPKYASISAVSLGPSDKVSLGSFTIEYVDLQAPTLGGNVTKIYFRVTGPTGAMNYVASTGEWFAYPNTQSPYLNVSVLWIKSEDKSALIEIQSPLQKLLSNQSMLVGGELTLPQGLPQIKIKLTAVSGDQATFQVTLPYGETRTLIISKGSGGSVRYKLGDNYYYNNYLYIQVLNTVTNGATFDVYIPKVASTSFKILRANGGVEGGGTNTPSQVEDVLVYSGLLYVNEQLPVKYQNTTYYVKLLTTIPSVAKIEVLKGSQSLGTALLEVGDLPKVISNSPFKISVSTVEPNYKRATIRIYAPPGTEVTPILRRANVMATINATPRKIMLSDNLVVVINVENLGRGDAYDVSVAAPIPNDFQLVSQAKSWNLKTLSAFTNMPALIYILKPTKVGKFEIGKAIVTFYDDQSLETGQKRIVYSPTLAGVEVYNVPSLSVKALAYNGTWGSYITTDVNKTVSLKFTVNAGTGNKNYEYVQNATLILDLSNSLNGPSTIKLGTIRAGETKTVQVDLKVLSANITNIRATLMYTDPIGNVHQTYLGNLVTINSIPPKVVLKEVKVYPRADELPGYINRTLSSMTNPEPIAKEIAAVAQTYLPSKSNTWKGVGILFIILTIVLAGLTYRYWYEAEKLKGVLERKKKSRPGGLPKKEEESPAGKETKEIEEL